MNRRLRLPGVLVALAAACLFAPSAASASHIQGGSINSEITANGHLKGLVTFLTSAYGSACIPGEPADEMPNIQITNPSGQTADIYPDGALTRCLPSVSTATGTIDVDLVAEFGSAANGVYTLKGTASARVNGIINAWDPMNGGEAIFSSRVTKTGTTPSSAPRINSAVANAVAKNYAFKQNLNGVDPDGSAVTYSSRATDPTGPKYDVVTIGANGVVSMTAPQTNAFNDGDFFSYTARVTDAAGDYSERDVLLTVTGNNAPPSIQGLPGSAIAATAGAGAQNTNFTATDPNVGQTVSLAVAAGAPAWVSLTAPAGNPANATLTVNPPGNVPAGTYAFNIDGVDSHPSVTLFASEPVAVTVTNAVPNTTVGTKPSAVTSANAANFTFSSDEGGVTYECKLDAGAWASCVSPKAYTNLAEGAHTFQVRATDAANQTDASPDSYTWTVDTTAPATPVIASAPSALAQSSTFTFTTPGGETAECQVDGGAWTACASPFVPAGLADGPHAFKLRMVDGAGNHSQPAEASWTLDTAAPAPPALIGAPEGTITAKTAQFTWTGENGGSFECSLDGAAFTSCASPLALTSVANGKHTFLVRQIDAAGNVGANRSIEWTVKDATKPTDDKPKAEDPKTDAPKTPTTPTTPAPAPAKVEAITGTSASVAVQGDTASVGCRVSGGTLSSCYVDVYAYDKADEAGVSVSDKAKASAAAAKKAKLVLIGRGHVKADAGDSAKRLAVDIELNAVGRRLVAEQITGINVVLKIEARTIEGPKLNTRTTAKLVPQTQLIVPESGLFASGSAKIAKSGTKLVKSLGDRLGKVKTVTCVGHTDSVGSDAANQQLGVARAKAVCAALKQHGARGKLVVESAGESRPRATNATDKGRALNRRVEISVRYR
ncbi:OmpA family protein [Solirubrobacter phytolaccae]|uniref:OmpA family protein n=1 Tax=Solirubrobacter phytolaccae TaxID=1404360 RepID=A0A9X3N516_9ACTN|nr:OmpA family protein [Solirubrobacter phytolaccae]MDA0179803.1 OmpA family protein [Solirubrobacter phytolaccae]